MNKKKVQGEKIKKLEIKVNSIKLEKAKYRRGTVAGSKSNKLDDGVTTGLLRPSRLFCFCCRSTRYFPTGHGRACLLINMMAGYVRKLVTQPSLIYSLARLNYSQALICKQV